MEYKKEEELNECVELFISILIFFPEISKLCFKRDSGILQLFFLLKEVRDSADIIQREKQIEDAIDRYHRLNKTDDYRFVLQNKAFRNHVLLIAERDMKTFFQTEVPFLIELFRMEFMDCLMVEKTENTVEEDYRFLYEDGGRLSNYRQELRLDRRKSGHDIMVCRENGKVLVFNN